MRARVVRTQWRCNHACPANQLARVSGADHLLGLTPSGVGSGDIDARDVKAQEAAEGCAEYERPQEHRQYR